MSGTLNRARCATERCHKYVVRGYPYCAQCLAGFMGELPPQDATGDGEGRIPGFEWRQAARARKANSSQRVEDMAPGGRLAFWQRRLKEAWRKVA